MRFPIKKMDHFSSMYVSRLGEFCFGYFHLKKEATQGRVVSLQGHNESNWVCVCVRVQTAGKKCSRESKGERGAQRPTLQSGDPTRALAHTRSRQPPGSIRTYSVRTSNHHHVHSLFRATDLIAQQTPGKNSERANTCRALLKNNTARNAIGCENALQRQKIVNIKPGYLFMSYAAVHS